MEKEGNVIELLTSIGNETHLTSYISYFESQIEKNEEYNRLLTQSPNYYVWLYLTSDFIFYSIRQLLYWNNNKDEKFFDETYKKLLDQLFEQCQFEDKTKECIILFAQIRHLLVHKGFPNLHSAPIKNSRPLAKGINFDEAEIFRVSEKIKSPQEYKALKNSYKLALESIRKKANFN